jgi:flagellar M-ring protein FliF
MQNVQDTLRRLWQNLTWGQRVTLFVLTIAVIVTVLVLYEWASTPTYAVLFSDVSPSDAGTITTQLQSSGVPYQLTNSGTTIEVPTSMVDSERIKLADLGLPSSGTVGFEIFDKQNLFQGDSFTEQINYTRALEGELTSTISQVQGVQYAKVNIVLPQQSLFSSDQASPTASVLLKLGMSGLSTQQVAGIQHLVASAVQGLQPDAVTVVNSTGDILSGNSSESASAEGLSTLQAEAQYASNLEAQVGAMLDAILGPGHAVVRVNDVLDFTTHDTTSTTYTPQSGNSPLASSQTIINNTAGAGSAAGGVVGLGSNVPTYGITTTNTVPATNTQSEQTLTFVNSITNTHVVAAPGNVAQLSVAVVLDNATKGTANIAALTNAVKNAIGFSAARGDQISVSSVAFDTSLTTAADKAAASQQLMGIVSTALRWLSLIVVPLVLLVILRRILVPKQPELEDEEGFQSVEVTEDAAPAITPAALLARLPAPPPNEHREALSMMARQKPEVVAGVIGRWIEEDR